MVEHLLPDLDSGTTVLVKGSRAMRMGRVIRALCADGAQGGGG